VAARIALVTCATLPDLDPDDRLLIEPLGALGIESVAVAWDDTEPDWASFDLAVIRSTWDYAPRRSEFVSWARSVPRLANPADLVEWNTDKRYLGDLAAAGVPVVPTSWLAPGDAVVLPPIARLVVKPSVGAGSRDAAAFATHHAHEQALANQHAERLLAAGNVVMIQPNLDAIDVRGETALLFLGGEFSHSVSKQAMLGGDRELVAGLYYEETIERSEPTAAEMELAERALAAVPGGPERLAYARVDVVPDEAGEPVVLELELTEPSLFLNYADGAAERFAAVIAAMAEK
jgi:hypothetical protein